MKGGPSNRSYPRPTTRAIALIAAVALLSVGGVACGGAGESESEGKVVFGADTQLSGSLQIYGLPAAEGLEAAAEDINAGGGIKVGDETLEAGTVIADNRSNPSVVASAAQKVADANPIAAVAPELSGNVAYNIWKAEDIITFSGGFDLQAVLEEDLAANPTLFTPVGFFSRFYVRNMKALAVRFPELKTVAILAPNDENGKGALAAFTAASEAAGITVLSGQTYPPEQTDFSSILTGLRSEAPDLIIALEAPEQALTILEQAAELGVDAHGLTDTATPDQILERPQLRGEPVIIANFGPTFSDAATVPDYEPEELFPGKRPESPGAAIAMYYAFHLLVGAIESAGTATDAAAIAKELPGQSYDGPFGKCTITDEHETSCESTIEVVDGEEVEILRYANPVVPKPSETYICRSGKCRASD